MTLEQERWRLMRELTPKQREDKVAKHGSHGSDTSKKRERDEHRARREAFKRAQIPLLPCDRVVHQHQVVCVVKAQVWCLEQLVLRPAEVCRCGFLRSPGTDYWLGASAFQGKRGQK
jgi:hypothetical protein